MREGGPVDFSHGCGQAAEVSRVVVQPRKARLIVEIHVLELDRDFGAIRGQRAPTATSQRLWPEPLRVFRRAAIKQRDLPPILGTGVERAAQIHGVDFEAVEHPIFRLGELLDHIVNLGFAGGGAQMAGEPSVGNRGNPRRWRGSEVNRHPIGFAMGNGGENAFAGSHHGSLWRVEHA